VNKADDKSARDVKEKFDAASHFLDLIKGLEQKTTDIWANTTVSCCLARYYMVSKDEKRARKAVVNVIAASIALLSDDEESNDWFAYLQLGKVLNALQDKNNSEEAWKRLDKLGKQYAELLPLFSCARCDEHVRKGGVHICMECFGPKYFDKKCYAYLKSYKEVNGCFASHKFVTLFPETEEQKDLAWNEKVEKDTSLKRWKSKLQDTYLDGEDVPDFSSTIVSMPASTLEPSSRPEASNHVSITSRYMDEDKEDRMVSVTRRGMVSVTRRDMDEDEEDRMVSVTKRYIREDEEDRMASVTRREMASVTRR